MRFRLSALIIILLVLCPSALAIGISVPDKYKFDFEPGLEKRAEFRVYNSHNMPIKVAIQLGGDLLPYATQDKTEMLLDPKGAGTFFVRLTLPDELPMGEHRLDITAVEQPPPGITMSANAAVSVYLQFSVPYEGKYLRASLDVPSLPEGEPLRPKVTVENLGSETVDDVYADVTVLNDDDPIGTISTNHAVLVPKQMIELTNVWNINLTPGQYKAIAVVHGGDNEVTATDEFVVGIKDIDLVAITKDVYAGVVNPVSFSLISRWNSPLTKVRVRIVGGLTETLNFETNGPDFPLYPFRETQHEFYMKVPDIPEGEYPGMLEAFYEGEYKNWTFMFNVHQDAELQAAARSGKLSLWGVRLLMLAVLVVIILLYLRRKKEENNGS